MQTESSNNHDKPVIVVVEDSPTQARELQFVLEQEGMHVELAENGRVGLQMAQDLSPAAVVLDIEMPEMNGFQVCAQLKESRTTRHIPVIILTRHEDQETVVLGLQYGAIEYIPKDIFAKTVLIETLRQMGIIQA
jgi:DNA-binding response OmpR family regulator